jgi:hypothetical protein
MIALQTRSQGFQHCQDYLAVQSVESPVPSRGPFPALFLPSPLQAGIKGNHRTSQAHRFITSYVKHPFLSMPQLMLPFSGPRDLRQFPFCRGIDREPRKGLVRDQCQSASCPECGLNNAVCVVFRKPNIVLWSDEPLRLM